MKIGDLVRYRGRLYWLRGFTPRSVHDEQVELQDVRTAEWITAAVDQVKPTRRTIPTRLERDEAEVQPD